VGGLEWGTINLWCVLSLQQEIPHGATVSLRSIGGPPLEKGRFEFPMRDQSTLRVEAFVQAESTTGLEIEVVRAVGVAALTIDDMCKSAEREMTL